MKKALLSTIILLSFIVLVGCKKKEFLLTSDDVSANTLLMKRDGSLLVATIEDFSKEYYNLSELNDFVTGEINAYNKKVGSDEISIEELEIKNGKAIMILRYSKMEHYSEFNKVPAAYYGTDLKEVDLELPSQYIKAGKDKVVDMETAMKNSKNKVLVVYEPYDIIVEGDVKFYSDNATLIEDNKVQSIGEEATVVIFRP
ncbi:hypothetical protein [Herbinix luporum]|jgi:hypothetical protein|uniref:Uncharacterized protein n=1 Tax=Herbinix luporum TaxID=1679721 RepID=A0A0K8J3W1_9FIRM|nr:hypothetical protein [Herbinix luporum]MDI9488991.1 hypothetical protein [Bacillota bacterium]CUH92023.1 hypothetical protein SD1D_0471 [Herbinix luporum]HHT56458.1 hypothetical protein [Herbinix luporum]